MIIDGKAIAQKILMRLETEVANLPFRPVFIDCVVGDDPVSLSYVRIKGKTAEKLGMEFKIAQYPATISTEALIDELTTLQGDARLCGLIVQLPVPEHIDKQAVIDAIKPELDVDCIGTVNMNAFYANEPSQITLPTAGAVIELLQSIDVSLAGKSIVVVGQGELVGRPVTQMLRAQNLEPNIADASTTNLAELLSDADIVISGTGQPNLITGSMIKDGAVVIDAGTAESNGGIVGDVDFASVEPKAAYVSPVPGGVGPVTVAKLLENVAVIARRKLGDNSNPTN